MDSDVNGANKRRRLRVRSSRLGQRIVLSMFVTLLTVNAISFVPSYLNREQELLHDLERQGAKTITVLLSESADHLRESLIRHSELVFSRTPIVGFVVYSKNGQILWSAGESVELRLGQLRAPSNPLPTNDQFERTEDGTRFETFWTPSELSAPYSVAVRLDSSHIGELLADYTVAIVLRVLAVAAALTIVLFIALNKVVLKPVIAIHQSLRGAGDDLGSAHEWVIENPSDGEIGDLTVAVNQILRNVSENFRTGQKQNEEILEQAKSRLQAEEEARIKHRQLVEAIEAFPGGFAVFDDEDRLMLSNETWKEFYPECTDIIVPGVKFGDILRAGIAADRKRGHYAYGAYWMKDRMEQHRNGTTDMERRLSTGRWMRSTERRTEDGGVLGIWTDISERKEAETERAELQAQFFQAQKNDALGTLAGGIAHDFNNLLAIILGNARLLEVDIAPDAPGREELDAITGAGNRAKDLVKQILSFARRDAGQFEVIDLQSVTEEALSLMRATLPKSITTEARLGGSAPIVGDPTQMHQIVMNLCINARDAIGDMPGRLIVELGDASASPDWPAEPDNWTDTESPAQRVIFQQDGDRSFMWMGAQPAGVHVRLRVSDSGCGIEPETFQKIFDPFFTTKDVGKGTGLGLAAVQGIIRSHGGSIHVESMPGEGTDFEIRIPRHEGEVQMPANEPLVEGQGSGRILLVDDEDQIVTVLRKSLERKGYEVTGMTDSSLALQAIENEPDRWDVIITDINMPRLNGIQIAQAVHSVRPNLPVILCSGSMETAHRQDLNDRYCSAVVEKPVQETDLIHAIQRCMTENDAEGEL
jgi:signal transduction histidine kinase/CheY-like chemotaxis protein